MTRRIIRLALDGQTVLGFDTGLDAKAFAQAKMAQCINLPGHIIYPSGEYEPWKVLAVLERRDGMLVWGPDFPGERFEELIDAGGDTALAALRHWVQARRRLLTLAEEPSIQAPSPPWPAGTLMVNTDKAAYPLGTILIPPERFLRRALDAEGRDAWLLGAERWVHPARSGAEALAFTAAALFYRICCGEAPYQNADADALHEDILEGVFIPPALSTPGLDQDLAALLGGILAPKPGPPGAESLEKLSRVLGSGGVASFFRPLDGEARAKWEAERERYRRNKERTVKAKRFLRRNKTLLAVSLAAVIAAALIGGSVIQGRSNLPTTKGLSPGEVIDAYYGAMNSLDHSLMEACVMGKAGKGDITMVTNMFVIGKVRQAYEMTVTTLSPQQWFDMGAPPTEAAVFGVSDLRFTPEDAASNDAEIRCQVQYTLWLPAAYHPDTDTAAIQPGEVALPQGVPVTDRVLLVRRKNAWRIAEIARITEAR